MASGQQDQALMPVGGSGGLMLPPAPRPPTKRKVAVLDEDEYTANLESIIERDFFPELSKLESKVAWLQAIRSGDPEQIREAQMLIARRRAAVGGRPLTGVTPSAAAPLFTPGGTAARAMVGDTPYIPVLPPGVPLRPAQARPATGGSLARGTAGGGEDDDDDDDEERVVVAPPVSLDGFLAVHTSEDNASFQEILEGVNKRKRQRAAALLIPQPDPKLMITEGRERTDGFGTSGQQPDTLVQWKYEPRNALYYDSSHRDAVPFSDAELAAMVQGAPKAINHGGTRFPRELAPSSSATPSASSGGGGSGSVAGGTAGAAAAAAGAAAAAARGAAAGRGGGGSGAGYSIMGTPSFSPGVGQTPIMTWGDIDATPLRIEVEDLPPGPFTEGPSFYIKEASRKDQAGHVLATKAGASLRLKRGSLQGGTPLAMVAAHAAARRQGTAARLGTGLSGRPPTDGQQQQRRGKPLSAAAQRLASSMHKGRQTDTDMGLRASYSGSTPVQRLPGTGRQPASSIASGSWSAQPTPRRGATPAGSCTPSVHATLEEEELRVQAVLRQRQRQTQQQQELEAARVAAKQALQNLHVQPAARAAAPAAAGGAANTSLGGAATSDLTAGLLDI